MSHTPYYYAPGGKYVLFLDLLGFTAFVRSSLQKKAEEADEKSAPAEAQIHYDKTLCFIRRMEEFRSWYSSCCRTERVANVVYPERKNNMRFYGSIHASTETAVAATSARACTTSATETITIPATP